MVHGENLQSSSLVTSECDNLLDELVIGLSSLPRPKMLNTDLARIINSDEIQRSIRYKK